MTDLPLPTDADALDEMASRWLDDDLTVDERARVEADPAVLARADELAQARATLSLTPVPPMEPGRAAAALGAALAAFDDLPASAPAAGSVVPMRRRRQQRVLAWAGGLAAAAAVGVVAVGVGPRLGSEEPDDFAGAPTMTEAPSFAADDELSTMALPESAGAVEAGAVEDGERMDASADVPDSEAPTEAGMDDGRVLALAGHGDLRLALDQSPLPQIPICPLGPGQSSHGTAFWQGTHVEVVYDVYASTIRAVAIDDCRTVTEVPYLP